ncbi:Radical SAM domain-containing protein [Helicobacter sp. NHP19-012]|uniref:Radical SAM domain-containing protein n=1 Tax=Helicobacter gastrofelis TaxID=2849642 RepID=A0ABM7SEH0_9HELI|nr:MULTISPECIES: radical SAM protein [unclassified Helicobacter]BCZ18765.1 Radical SAM domain-containing protein [Helicobacter sp. NHP19-012]GMB96181.1 Radical SAM domain-containing protein [Helicobacter sp. NHP22-001]
MFNPIFGPLKSRRFGWSLGIDVSGQAKQCNFDCLYCELVAKKPQEHMQDILAPTLILNALKSALDKLESPLDVCTTTANGEPTLYPYLKDLIVGMQGLIPKGVQTLILSNGSRFGVSEVQEALVHYDIVKFSLDAIWPKVFSRIDRPHKDLSLAKILEGVLDFAPKYGGFLVAEVLLVAGVNDNPAHIKDLADFLRQVPNLRRIDLSTIDRPPAHQAKPLEPAKLQELMAHFQGLPLSLPKRVLEQTQVPSSKEAFLELLRCRPLSVEEARCYLSARQLQELQEMGALQTKQVGQIHFYYHP